jgi:hypothetical protein
MYQEFKIDRLEYGLGISKSGNVWLDLLGGVTKTASANRNPCKNLFWDEPVFADVDLGVNTFKVLNMAQKLLLSHVFTKKPYRIGFCALTNRRTSIYRWLAARVARQIQNYLLVEFPEGVFNFYRQVQPGPIATEEDAHERY